MSNYLEAACGWFGARSCESASGTEVFMMVFAVAFAGLALVWIVGKIRFAATN